ncbi:hypothetical protein CEXT_219801 [Caerostris extrusa]|uniref:Uncharacterized protein n=1 Tax=Caerostris extrusa TaxID=172846 RepID=A0AAV4QRI0_CAEEX|nr:hypothetical protein CEXT_219801 [Caerostris extrusa]
MSLQKTIFQVIVEYPQISVSMSYLLPRCDANCLAMILSNYKDEWAALIVLFLRTVDLISVFRSRPKIRLLSDKLFRISNMLRIFAIQKKKTLKIYIWIYCLFVAFMTVFFEMMLFSSGLIKHEHHKLRNLK